MNNHIKYQKNFTDYLVNLRTGYLDYASFLNLTKLDNPISIQGIKSDYVISEAHTISIKPTLKNVQFIFSFFNYINLFNTKLNQFIVEIVAYNYSNNVFIRMLFIIESDMYGYIETKANLCVINFLTIAHDLTSFNINANTVIGFFFYAAIIFYSLYNLVEIIYYVRIYKLRYFKKIWNVIKSIQIILYIVSMTLRLSLYKLTRDTLTSISLEKAIDVNDICQIYDNLLILEILMICSTSIYFLKYLDENIVGPIIDTLNRSGKNIIVFISSYAFAITGFGICFNYIYGSNMYCKIFLNM